MVFDEFLASLAFGAATIVVFAREQFARPSYSTSGDLARVVEVLGPRDLRRSRVYFSAYVAYAGALLLIYIALCMYATVPMLALVGFDSSVTDLAALPAEIGAAELPIGYDEPAPPQGAGRNPALPLVISAAMVGLAPAIPWLRKTEEHLRVMAHRLSGIPTRLIDGARTLVSGQRWIPREQMASLGVSNSEDERCKAYTKYAAGREGAAAFALDLDKIIAFRAWFIDERVAAPKDLPEKVVALAALIDDRIRKVFASLDDLRKTQGAASPVEQQATSVRWDETRRDADRIAFDICLLLMLYDEHGLPTAGPGSPDDDAHAQRQCIHNRVDSLLSTVSETLERTGIGLAVWWRATLICVLVAFLWDLAINPQVIEGEEPGNRFFIGLRSGLSSIIQYAPALFVALTHRDAADREQEWRNPWTTNWSSWLLSYIIVFIFSSVFTLFFVLAHNLYWAIEDNGVNVVQKRLPSVIAAAVRFEGPRALVGPILAVALLAVIDARQAGRFAWVPADGLSWRMFRRSEKMPPENHEQGFWFGARRHAAVLALPLAAATTMSFWAALSRGWASQTAADFQELPQPSLAELFLQEPEMTTQAILAFLIGFFCVYFVQNLVIHGIHRRSARPSTTPVDHTPELVSQ